MTIEVGAIILAPGFEPFDAGEREEYGLGRWKNVVSALQFERILSASGPFQGKLTRPGDHTMPGRIAFFQCIGSREEGREYCSSVCCMHATKQALLVKEHYPAAEVEIFFIDLRAHGKGYEAFYERARQAGVKYTRCRVSAVKEAASTGNLTFQLREEEGTAGHREVDLAVLSCGFSPPPEFRSLSALLHVSLDKYGFCSTQKFTPLSTTRKGVFACGTVIEPKDIPDTVSEGSGAAVLACRLLSGARHSLVRAPVYPPERKTDDEPARIGVFICHCGKNIGGVVDVPSLVEYAAKLPGVVLAEENLYTCSQDSLGRLNETI
jgi:heterodisulfide reductase subunit A